MTKNKTDLPNRKTDLDKRLLLQPELWHQRPVPQKLIGLAAQQFPGRWMGIDWGTKRIGIALSDPGMRIANGHLVFDHKRQGHSFAAIAKLVASHQISCIVLGLPLSMDGNKSPRTQAVMQIGWNWFKSGHTTPVLLFDERLSTQASQRMLIETVDMGRMRRRQIIDKLSAAWFLQNALDRIANDQAMNLERTET